MRTTISVAVTAQEVAKTKKLAKKRGFLTVSDYFRFLLAEDDVTLIGEDEVRQRGREVERLARQGKLIRGKTMRDLLGT